MLRFVRGYGVRRPTLSCEAEVEILPASISLTMLLSQLCCYVLTQSAIIFLCIAKFLFINDLF